MALVLSSYHSLPQSPLYPAASNKHPRASHLVVKARNEELLSGSGKEHFRACTTELAAAPTLSICCICLLVFLSLLRWPGGLPEQGEMVSWHPGVPAEGDVMRWVMNMGREEVA